MGRGSHNKKPDHLKVIQGTFRKSTSNPNAPEGKRGIPKSSTGLVAEARKEYKKLAVLLDDMGVLCEADGGELESLAIVRCQIQYAQSMLFQQKNRKSYRQWQLILNDAIRISNALSLKFGLTPADRSRVSVIEKRKPSKSPFSWEDV